MKKITTIVAAAALLLFAAFTEGGYKVGDKAADFKLKNVTGKWLPWPIIKMRKA